jgi:hypothetical protein
MEMVRIVGWIGALWNKNGSEDCGIEMGQTQLGRLWNGNG